MGMYTEFVCAMELKKDTPKNVIDTLKYMLDFNTSTLEEIPTHEFFECSRWRHLLSGDSYSFPGETYSILRYDENVKCYLLTIRSSLKNYDGEIDKFLNWIKPYIIAYEHDFLGYSRYEECNEPELIYYDEIQ